ncbi:GIY-YIG nuclease family protein [Xanthomonas arboricola]|uniref:GIY-YIG nuclease family protein n=1 Tax=Xanthomonas arboricola TaxID=56448 RepID=UPI003CCCF8DB
MRNDWSLYIAAVPLLSGKSAFRIGRTRNISATVKALSEGSPIPVSQISVIRVGSNRFALAAEAKLLKILAGYSRHGAWIRLDTSSEIDKRCMSAAMRAVSDLIVSVENNQTSGWKTLACMQ